MTLCLLNFLEGHSRAEQPYMRKIADQPVAELKDGIWSLSLFPVFLVCTWLLVENLLYKDGGANPFIHLTAIKMSLTPSCLATGNQWSSFNIGMMCSLIPCYPVSLLPWYLVTLFPCYLVTLLLCYLVTVLLWTFQVK